MKNRILFGIPPHAHVSLAMDEVNALERLGWQCYTTSYARNNQQEGKIKKIIGTIRNAFALKSKLKNSGAAYLYLNSRFEPAGSIRDFITLMVLHFFYTKHPKVIIKSHGSDCSILSNNSFLYKKVIVPFLTRKVDTWIFLSTEEKVIIERLHPVMAEKVHVLPNIIATERIKPSPDFKNKYQLPTDKFICLYVGRLIDVKGIFDILDSVGFLHLQDKFHFVFVGSGPHENELKQRANQLADKASIQFTGYIKDTECDQFYMNADVLIYPTYDTEGFCMALFKSIACGLPVITTRVRAAKDYLSEPQNVLWVNEKSPKEIAQALERLYLDNSMKTSMMENNKLLGKTFSPEKVAIQMDAIFKGNHIPKPVLTP